MTDKQKQILSLVLTAVISLVVGVCGVFGNLDKVLNGDDSVGTLVHN